MKKIVILIVCSIFCLTGLSAQKYFTREGKISFFSEAPMEKIEAHNNKATSVIDAESGKMEFAVLIKAFQFEKALMQEHFNENYLESDKFPKSKFKGQITNIEAVKFNEDGNYDVEIEGRLTIHGVTNEVKTKGTIKVIEGQISADAQFDIAVAEYEIEIPAVVRENIAKIVTIQVDISNYQLFNQ